MKTAVDLSGLAVRRANAPPTVPTVRRHWVSRVVVPGVILAGFAGVLAWTARDFVVVRRAVTVVPVLVTRSAVNRAGTPLFQAAGWVEPRPTPVVVTALAEGIVERLLVVENQEVAKGEVIAQLIDADARLALADAEASLRLLESQQAVAAAAVQAAETRFDQPVHLESALAGADAELAEIETELANLPSQLKGAEARLKLAQQDLDGKLQAGDSIAGRTLQRAQSELDGTRAAAEELRLRAPRLETQQQALTRKRTATARQLELKTDETRARAEARANLDAAKARVDQAKIAVQSSQLRLDRMTIRAPSAGRVLALVARPGSQLMGTSSAEHNASTVVTLYDPAMLQVRADVRLEDVPHVQPGQPAQIETPASPGPLEGEVLLATSQANVAKNTLEVKIAVKSPPPVLKPQMLVQVTVLAAAAPHAEHESPPETLRLLIPKELVEGVGDKAFVWIADQAERVAVRKPIKTGAVDNQGFIEVLDGLQVGDRLIVEGREGLEPGEPIEVTQEAAHGAS